MRYMMLVCVDESVEVSPEEALPTAWVEEMDDRGVRQFGSRLRPVSDATTVQVRDGEVLLGDSIRSKPPICSLVSANGPSPTRSSRNGDASWRA